MKVGRTIIRLLTFRIARTEMLHFNTKHFIAGLIGTWVHNLAMYSLFLFFLFYLLATT